MDIRWSNSTIKVFKSCPFRFFCKITEQKKDDNVDVSYGQAGNVVHHALEYYFKNLLDIPLDSALVELKNVFNEEWEACELTNPVIKKDLYWLCVINGIKLNVKATDLEHEFRIQEDGINFIGYADIMNTKEHWIGDWKTSTYKKAKVEMYKSQLQYYAWAYWKEHNVVPMTWVYFNKVNKIFKFQFPTETIKNIEIDIRNTDKLAKKKLEAMDFERRPSRNNCYFCPYKNICATDLLREKKAETLDIKFHIKKNKLLIEGSIPDIIHRKIEKRINYEIKNAHFIKQAMLAKGIHYDGIKRLYRRRDYGGETFLGYFDFVYSILKEFAHSKGKKIKATIYDFRDQDVLKNTIKTNIQLDVPFTLYKFQLEAVEALLKHKWGIIEIGTGGGKTVIAAESIRRLKLKTLFVIDNKDLLLQTKREYEKMLGVTCGIVGMGYREWDKPVVLATIQTLAKYVKDFSAKLAEFPVLVLDESHIIASKSYETLSKHLINTQYRFGFSATPRRDDGNDNIIYAHTGTVVYKKGAQDLIQEGVLVEPTAIFYNYDSKSVITDNWQSEYADSIVDNEYRNTIIKNIAEQYKKDGKQIMILTKMVRHGQWFLDNIEGSNLIYGKTADVIREEVLNDFTNGKFQILIGNLKIFNKGINIKNLDVIINAAANAGEVVTVQSIGRALRNNKGKTEAHYIDFMDAGEYLHKHSLARIQALKDQEYKVEIRKLNS